MRPARLVPVVVAVALFVVALAIRAPAPAAPAGDTRLAAARADAASAVFEAVKASSAAGRDTTETVYTWSVRLLTSQLDAGAKPAAAIGDHLQRMKELEAAVKTKFESGIAAKSDTLATAYYRAEAEHWAARKKIK
jgi:hypothetical protein